MDRSAPMPVAACDGLEIERWVGAPPAGGDAAQGALVVLLFQMLCRDAVCCSLPQLERIHARFAHDGLSVVALHAVHERHDEMGPEALQRFLSRAGYRFPVGIDRLDPMRRPISLARLGMDATPALVVFDAQGRMRHRHAGLVSDLVLAADLAWLLAEQAFMQRRGQDRSVAAPLVPATFPHAR